MKPTRYAVVLLFVATTAFAQDTPRNAQISFGVEAGAVTHLVLHQNGRDLTGTRRQP